MTFPFAFVVSLMYYIAIYTLTVTLTTTASFRFFYVALVGVIAGTSAVEVAVSYFERQLFFDKMDAELRAAQGSAYSPSSKVKPRIDSNSIVPESSVPPERKSSFHRHNSKNNGFAFAHPEGGDIRQRNLSFMGIRLGVDTSDEEKVP